MGTGTRTRIQAMAADGAVTPLELFFDLVFVYALTQVTSLIANNLSGRGLLEGAIVLALVWWCWVGYSWLGNAIQADEGLARAGFIAVMAAMFVAAAAIPEAFHDRPGGLSAPLVLACCYAVVRGIHLGFYALAARQAGDRGLMRQLLRFAAVTGLSVALMFAGAGFDGNAQIAWWLAAVAVDYVGTQVIGAGGWRLYAPKHFSERHGLIVLIALGESIVAIGVGGSSGLPLSAAGIVAAIFGILLVAALWWVYFDVTAIAAERRLSRADGVERARLARDGYTYMHLPMIAGVVLAAVGLKKVLAYSAGDDGHDWQDALHGIALWAVHLGPALFVLALILFRLTMVRSLGKARTVAVVVLVATTPLGLELGVLLDLVLVTAIMAALIAFEAIRYRESRHRIRHLEGHAHAEGGGEATA